jgi:hypothetical protein
MNAEVEVHIGEARGVLAVPSGAVRPWADALAIADLVGLSAEEAAGQLDAKPEEGLVAFVRRNGEARAVAVRTGLTDFDYTAVLNGLVAGDSVYLLPTTGLLDEQRRRNDWARARSGSPLSGGGR